MSQSNQQNHISSLQQMKSPVFVKALRFRFLTNRCHPTEAATSNNDVGRHFRQHLEPSGKLLLLTIVMAAAATAAKSDRQTTNFAPLSMNDMGN